MLADEMNLAVRGPRRTRPRLWRREVGYWLLGSVALVLLLLGQRGFAADDPRRSATDNLYMAFHLFAFTAGDIRSPGWTFDVARFGAPLVTGYAAALTLMRLLRRRADPFRVWFWHGHSVVVGEGAAAREYVRQRRAARCRVIWCRTRRTADRDGDGPFDPGLVVLEGDDLADLLPLARVDRAADLVALAGDDAENVRAAVQAIGLLSDRRMKDPCRIRAEVDDRRLRMLVRRHALFGPADARVEAKAFSPAEISARLAFAGNPLETGPGGWSAERSHLLVIGLGQLGESMLLQAARIAHHRHGRRLKVTVADRRAASAVADLRLRFPGLDEVVDLASHEGPVEAVDPARWATLLGTPVEGELLTVAVCLTDEVRGLGAAFDIAAALSDRAVRVLVRVRSRAGMAELLEGRGAQAFGVAIHPVAELEEAVSPGHILDESHDDLARAVHAGYLRQRRADGTFDEKDPACGDWSRLAEDLRDSSRQQADHIGVKLAALGLKIAADASEGVVLPELASGQVELLARMEHSRWNADRWLAGWRPAREKDVERRLTPCLVPFDELPPKIADYDRQAVRQLPGLLREAGKRVVPLADRGRIG